MSRSPLLGHKSGIKCLSVIGKGVYYLPTYTQYTAAALSSRVLHVIEPRMGFMTLLWFRRRNCTFCTFLFNVFEIPSLQTSIFLGKSLLYCVCGDVPPCSELQMILSRNTIRHFHQADKNTFSIFKNIFLRILAI